MSQDRVMEKIRELARELSPENLDLAITDLQMIQEAAQQKREPDVCWRCKKPMSEHRTNRVGHEVCP